MFFTTTKEFFDSTNHRNRKEDQENLGHARVTTTERYSKALMEGKRKLVNSFEIPDTDQNIIELKTPKNYKIRKY